MSAGHVDERQPLIGRVDESGAHRAPRLGDDGEDAGRAKMGGGAWGVCTRVTVCAVAAMGLIGAAYRGLNHHHPATAVLLGLGDVPTVDAGLLGHADEAMHRADERRETARLARVDARRAERRAGLRAPGSRSLAGRVRRNLESKAETCVEHGIWNYAQSTY